MSSPIHSHNIWRAHRATYQPSGLISLSGVVAVAVAVAFDVLFLGWLNWRLTFLYARCAEYKRRSEKELNGIPLTPCIWIVCINAAQISRSVTCIPYSGIWESGCLDPHHLHDKWFRIRFWAPSQKLSQWNEISHSISVMLTCLEPQLIVFVEFIDPHIRDEMMWFWFVFKIIFCLQSWFNFCIFQRDRVIR